LLDARCSFVEADGEARDFVASFDGDACREIAAAEAFDAALQALQPARQATHDRIGARGHAKREQEQRRPRSDWPMQRTHRTAYDEPASVTEFLRVRGQAWTVARFEAFGARVPADPVTVVFVEARRRHRATGARHRAPVRVEQREVRLAATA